MIRSMSTESVDHESALRLIHTGRFLAGMPVWGSWVVYGLGTENANLPAYVVLTDPGGLPVDGERNWSSRLAPGGLPGHAVPLGEHPRPRPEDPGRISPTGQDEPVRWLDDLNRRHLRRHPGNTELEARVKNFETAARMQMAVPEVLDFSRENAATRAALRARQPGHVRVRAEVPARPATGGERRALRPDLHEGPALGHPQQERREPEGPVRTTDQPSAALVKDLKQRGLLESTIVIWTGEFGRLPISQGSDGRDHNRHGFSTWIAGGGFRGGYTHGATDDFGYKSVQDVVTVHDLHATLLHALGLDHRKLAVQHDGRGPA